MSRIPCLRVERRESLHRVIQRWLSEFAEEVVSDAEGLTASEAVADAKQHGEVVVLCEDLALSELREVNDICEGDDLVGWSFEITINLTDAQIVGECSCYRATLRFKWQVSARVTP